MAETKTKKVMGWKKCTVVMGETTYNDIKEGTTSLSVEEGQETEATIEGGEAEGRHKDPDKYVLTIERRIGSEEVKPGFIEDAGDVEVKPSRKGARTVKLTGVSQHISVKYDSTDGAVAVYKWKTKGQTDEDGNLTDISIGTVPLV